MRICIVIAGGAFLTSAGMRIRYDRFAECLPDGVTIEARTCADLSAAPELGCDVYVFAKSFDIAAALLARRVRAAGKIVGQDLFDDYFSDARDNRLGPYRDGLRMMAPATDFATCSTPRMVEAVGPLLPGIPIAAIGDPVGGYDPLAIGPLSDAKTRRSRAARTLDIVWFGMGDNPVFPVGLADLAAFESEFARIERRGWTVRLALVTNDRAFQGTGLGALRAIGVEHDLIAWSEQSERAALRHAAVAVLPVNAQPFSRAKSLNRAITALAGGCQVLSLGFPLYEPLDAFIYRSADELVDDLEAGACRLRADRIAVLTETLGRLADPFAAAAALVDLARQAIARRGDRSTLLTGVIHGRQPAEVGAFEGVSIASPFCPDPERHDVRFQATGGRLAMHVTAPAAARFGMAAGTVDLAALGVEPLRIFQPIGTSALHDLALYADVVAYIERCCRAAFGCTDIVLNEPSPLKRVPQPAADAA